MTLPKNSKKSTASRLSFKGECWLCERTRDVEATDVIGEDNQNLLQIYCDMGLLYTAKPKDYRLILCECCRMGFSDSIPGWIFLPTDLEVFFNAEKEFQAKRESRAKAGMKLERPSLPHPKRSEESEFKIYQTREDGVHMGELVLKASQVRTSKINPVVAILHSAGALYKHVRLPGEKYGLPEDVSKALYDLLYFYGKPEPETTPQATEENEDPDDSAIYLIEERETVGEIESSRDQDIDQELGAAGPSSKRKRHRSTNIESGSADEGDSVDTIETVPSSNTEFTSSEPQKKRPKSSSRQKAPAVETSAMGEHATSPGMKQVDIRTSFKGKGVDRNP